MGQGFKVYGSTEEPLFLAKDVAEWIGHTNLTMMLKSVDEEEKVKGILPLNNVYPQRGSGGLRENTEANFLTEDGIYEVLMTSRKPIAKQWKKEVKKILKNIRLNGGHVQVDREKEFIDTHFPSLSEDTKKAMVLDLRAQNLEMKKTIEVIDNKVERDNLVERVGT